MIDTLTVATSPDAVPHDPPTDERFAFVVTGNVADATVDGPRGRAVVEEVIDGVSYRTVWFYWRYADGWRHVSVPLTAPVDQARAFTIQLFGGGNQNINGTVDLRLDNLVLRSSSPPGVSRAGHHFSYESPSQVDPAHPGHDESSAYVWGDSYQSSTTPVDHNQSTLYPTDGGHSMRMSQPARARRC